MREIKFRAWHLGTKAMIYSFPAVSHGEVNFFDFKFLESWSGGLIPMQFTGLHDKNGREIYEGDIVHVVIPTRWGFVSKEGVIKSERLGHCMVDWELDWIPLSDATMTPGYVEVIGNVYENADLLKGEKHGT